MIALYIILGLALVLLIAYLVLVAPGRGCGMEEFTTAHYAHRGLHNDERAENSMSAFRAAVESGYGIEMDIRLSKDGVLVVHHDDTLDRVAGTSGRVDEYTAEELGNMSLNGTADGVPRLTEVLAAVDGKVPLLIEIKEDAGKRDVTDAAVKLLADYKGPYIIESFNPLSIANFKKQMPHIHVGILSQNYWKFDDYKKPLYMVLQLMLLNFKSRPSFIAFCHSDYKAISFKVCKKLFGATTFAWTTRSQQHEDDALAHGFDAVIFEKYIPELK